MRWHKFTIKSSSAYGRIRGKRVLVQIAAADRHGAPAVAVGRLKYAAACKDCPYFVVEGFGREFVVTHWCDCLPQPFSAPLWKD